jgi:integrase/recombinase XerD
MKAVTSIFVDHQHPKKDGTCAVYIRVTCNRIRKFYNTGKSLTADEISKVFSEKPRNHYKETLIYLQSQESKAANIIKNLPVFSFALFEKEYLVNSYTTDTIAPAFKHYAGKLRADGRIGTAVSYECAQVSIDKFSPGAKYNDITVDWLYKYERWMLNQGNSITTVGMYLRALRALINIAIADKLFNKDAYPFGKGKYEIPTGKNKKKALNINVIELIYHYPTTPGTTADRAKDYWLFQYMGNGINMKDMSLLKYENIKGKFLEFERSKSQRTKREVEKIQVALTEELKTIISKHGNQDKSPANYIFPIITKGASPERQYQLVQQITGLVNDHIKAIAKALNIEEKVTTYVARHSFASILKRSGVSTEFIKDALGHSTVSTTENYLASFEDEVKLEAAKALTAFKSKSL